MSFDENYFISKLKENELKICIMGLGKMGLPIAMVFSNSNYEVIGYDISKQLVEDLNDAKTTLNAEPFVQERLTKSINNGNFKAYNEINEQVLEADVFVVIIPILNDEQGQQNLEILLNLYEKISSKLNKNALFIQESTLAPKTCKNKIWPILVQNSEKSNEKNRFGLVFAPERTFSGRVIEDIENNYPKIIGGIEKEHAYVAKQIYEKFIKKGIIVVSDTTTAEAIKTFKGAYRDINIAIANQMAEMADNYGVDILEVIDVANTEPFSNIHTPGMGVGGHCIPVYPKFLIYDSNKIGFDPTLMSESRKINDNMVKYCVDQLDKFQDKIKNILILGLAYRGGVKEFRNSPTLNLLNHIKKLNPIEIKIIDPLFTKDEINKIMGLDIGYDYDKIEYSRYDTIIVVTDHSEFKEMKASLLEGKIIYDGRYIFKDLTINNSVIIQPGRGAKLY